MSFSPVSEIALSVVVSGLTCYGLHQIEPVPDVNYLITVGIVNACVHLFLHNQLQEMAHCLSEKHGYLNKRKVTNQKFFCLAEILTIASVVLATIFYPAIGSKMGYQTPSYINTYGYLSLSMASIWLTKHVINFISSSYNAKPASGH